MSEHEDGHDDFSEEPGVTRHLDVSDIEALREEATTSDVVVAAPTALETEDEPEYGFSPEDTRPTGIRVPQIPAETVSEASLVTIYGEELGRRHSIPPSGLVIGRGPEAGIRLHDDTVSRAHCELRFKDDAVEAVDLGARNYSYVNDKPMSRQVMQDGDVLRIGHTLFKFFTGVSHEVACFDEIHQAATTDPLTGALNRRSLDAELDRQWYMCSRYERPMSVLMIDIDHFKQVNDVYGHHTGDVVLTRLARMILKAKRRSDIFGRYGGEEFVFVMPETSINSAIVVAERLRARVSKTTMDIEGRKVRITLSVGVASRDLKLESRAALIALADERLYKAKNQGRNRVVPAP
jgi:two-component system, cell cycle response regulator